MHEHQPNLAFEVTARGSRRTQKSEQLRVLKIKELAQKAVETEVAGKQEQITGLGLVTPSSDGGV
ncbi:hypothetical protein [Rhodanobacter sp. MP1X3]|uniref:hypothetical protein n=1 Tax=Rhodanobacter sp. MP1X3 TaxID=2723086 RepID=UPI0016170F79|nr:hypothetical protein [Rhodanobacter sp. MP1X3]MBB6241951.1 hypothetical protein [Rhodanobacter sp. MP1X3]